MSVSEEDHLLKVLKKKMAICTILQKKFGCKCVTDEKRPLFCAGVEELYNECLNQK